MSCARAVRRAIVENMGLAADGRAVGRRRIRDAACIERADQKPRGLADAEFCAKIPSYVDASCQLLDRMGAWRSGGRELDPRRSATRGISACLTPSPSIHSE